MLEAMGQKPTEEELFQMISEVDDNMSGSIDFGEFLKVIENQKERAENFDDENDMIDAFVACGGRPDKEGHGEFSFIVCNCCLLLYKDEINGGRGGGSLA